MNFINDDFINKLCSSFNLCKLSTSINNYDNEINIFNSNLIMKRYVIIMKDNIKYVTDKISSNIRISLNKTIYIIPFINNTFIRFYKSYDGLAITYMDYFHNFDNTFPFIHCYTHKINEFNKLLKNIYQYRLILN